MPVRQEHVDEAPVEPLPIGWTFEVFWKIWRLGYLDVRSPDSPRRLRLVSFGPFRLTRLSE